MKAIGGAGWEQSPPFGVLRVASYLMEFDPHRRPWARNIHDPNRWHLQSVLFRRRQNCKGGDIRDFGLWNGTLPAEDKVITAYMDDVTTQPTASATLASMISISPPTAGWIAATTTFTKNDYMSVLTTQLVGKTCRTRWNGRLIGTVHRVRRGPHCMGGIIYPGKFRQSQCSRASYGANSDGLNAKEPTLRHRQIQSDWANGDDGRYCWLV